MNKLAHVVHDLVTRERVTRVDVRPDLSSLEQAALADLLFLLRRPPRDLAASLAQEPLPIDWLNLPPLVCGPTPS